MKKLYIALLACFFVASNLSAQNDPEAKKILDGVSAKVKSAKAITASITLKSITSKGKANGTKTGTLSIKGEKYLLKQGKTEITCDGSKVYNYDGNKTITVTTVEENGSTLSPQKLLSGSYDKDFTYKVVSTKGGFYEIEMKPIDKRKNFQTVNLFVDKAKSLITKALIVDKSNNSTELAISNVNLNANVADNLFVFTKGRYPTDVEILD
ncbi:LolA family protein [Chitinophagaceae bacterium LWZ2-11]